MRVKVKYNVNWDKVTEPNYLKVALLEMVNDIQRRAIVIAPKDTRALVNSGKIDSITDGFKLTFGSSRVPYARKRHFENKKNPQSIGYLDKAADAVDRGDKSKYFRNKI